VLEHAGFSNGQADRQSLTIGCLELDLRRRQTAYLKLTFHLDHSVGADHSGTHQRFNDVRSYVGSRGKAEMLRTTLLAHPGS
jgi:hypothetical protein